MSKLLSAGLLLYKTSPQLQVFLAHPGGPFWEHKDEGAWGIPKGEPNEGEALFAAARREFFEETGISVPSEESVYTYLETIQFPSGKVAHCWAFEGDWSGPLEGTSFAQVEWPPRSGKIIAVPEIDKAEFFTVDAARTKMSEHQFPFVERLISFLKEPKTP